MATRSRLISGIYHYLSGAGDAPIADGGIPMSTVYEVIMEVEDSMLADLDLSDQNRTIVKGSPINLNANTFSIGASNVGSPSYALVQMSPNDEWWPVDIVNHGSLRRAALDGRYAVAFYGTPLSGETSWEVASGHRLQIYYDRTPDEDGDIDDSPIVGDAYLSHLKLQAAAQCRELMGLPVGDVLASRLAKGERQWKKYVTMSRQQGVVKKNGFIPPRLAGRRYIGRRRGQDGFLLP